MGQENWGRPGYPPNYVDVVGREVRTHRIGPGAGEEYLDEIVWLRGHQHGHLGQRIQGQTGPEVRVHRVIINGEMRVRQS